MTFPLIAATALFFACAFLIFRDPSTSGRKTQKGKTLPPASGPQELGAAKSLVYYGPIYFPPLSVSRQGKVSPYKIARFVNQYKSGERLSLESFWRQINISVENFKECNACKAAVFRAELDGMPGREIILRLHGPYIPATIYLIFKTVRQRSKIQWRFLGMSEEIFQPFDPPSHHFVTATRKHWMVISYQTDHGSGVGADSAEWYEIINGRVRKVLTHLSERYAMIFPECRDIRVKAGKPVIRQNHSLTSVTIPFNVTQCRYDCHLDKVISIRRRKLKAVYVRQHPSGRFTLDWHHSDLSSFSSFVVESAFTR